MCVWVTTIMRKKKEIEESIFNLIFFYVNIFEGCRCVKQEQELHLAQCCYYGFFLTQQHLVGFGFCFFVCCLICKSRR